MIAVRMMPVSVCLLLGAAGCAEMQKTKSPPASSAPAAEVVTRADLEILRQDYMKKLRLQNTSHVGEGPVKELAFFSFREDTGPAHAHFREFENSLKRLVESKNARISEWIALEEELRFQYDGGNIHGIVNCQLKSHRDSELPLAHWNINLTVKEEQRH